MSYCAVTKLFRDTVEHFMMDLSADAVRSSCNSEMSYVLKMLTSNGVSIKRLAEKGFTPRELANAGISISQLSLAGVSAKRLIQDGFTIAEFLKDMYPVDRFCREMVDPKILFDAGVSVAQLQDAGYQIDFLHRSGIPMVELYRSGIALNLIIQLAPDLSTLASDLIREGVNGVDLVLAGFSEEHLLDAGVTSEDLHYFQDKAKKQKKLQEIFGNLGMSRS